MFIKCRGIFFRLSSNYEVFLFVRRKSTYKEFQNAIDYVEIVINIWWVALNLKMRGIDPRTSRMLSERTNIWATNLAEFVLSNLAEFDKNLAEFFFA